VTLPLLSRETEKSKGGGATFNVKEALGDSDPEVPVTVIA
jgi:hypothetical protein